MTPTYAVSGGRRYRYYVSAPLVRGGSTKAGIRVPAPDLETLVTEAIAERLCDPAWVTDQSGNDGNAGNLQRLVNAAATLARSISCQQRDGAGGLAPLIERITVETERVIVRLNRTGLGKTLAALDGNLQCAVAEGDEPLEITVPARALRCGKQVRLVVGDVSVKIRSPDKALIELIRDAHRWFDDLRAGRAATIAEIAVRHHRQVSHVSRTLALAFLAPDIVEMILEGRQPSTLTPDKLTARRRPLPMNWSEQRALLSV
jgi:hypothetical protein